MKFQFSRALLWAGLLCFVCALAAPGGTARQGIIPPGCVRVPGSNAAALVCGEAMTPDAPRINPAETAAFKAFEDQADVDAKIKLGEQFDTKYPNSVYENQVDSGLASVYFNRQDWTNFYALGEKVIARNPKNFMMLELVGWEIPHGYAANDPAAASKLDESENYERRALDLIAAIAKPKDQAQADFDASMSSLAWRAHSGLGLTYLRRKDYADSAEQLQIAIPQETPEPDAGDLYALGIDLENLGRGSEAITDFSKCTKIEGEMQAQCQEALQRANAPVNKSAEQTAYDAFRGAKNADEQIGLGEKFDQAYPSSAYQEQVDGTLAGLYQGEQDWPKFYAAADKVLAKDPDNVPILTRVGWAIPHVYDANDPDASAKLDTAENDENRAIGLIATMKKPGDLTEAQFEQAKTSAAAQAHSGLGVTYFRRGDFADSARELQFATADPSQADPFDLYVLGVDLQKLNRPADAADAFAQCGAVSGSMQAQCKHDAEVAAAVSGKSVTTGKPATAGRPASAAELAVAAKAPAASPGGDFPHSTETQPTIKAESVLVPVHVVVRDTKGRAVADLKKEDFKLYQDGKQVEVSSFTAINFGALSHGGTAAPANGTPSKGSSPAANAASTSAPAATPTQFVALFFDDVHLYFSDMAQTRDAAKKFLKTLHPEDRVAIVTASGEGGTDFTSDRDALETAMAAVRPRPFPGAPPAAATATSGPCPPPMTYTEAFAITQEGSNGVAGVAGGDFAACYLGAGAGGASMADPQAGADAGGAMARAAAIRTQAAGEEATDAIFDRLERAIRRLSTEPSQRVIVMVSPGFVYSGHQSDFAAIINLALRNNVVINTLDAKGIYMGEGKWDPDRFRRFGFSHFLDEQPVLEDLADGTGGRFVKNNNDFTGVMREMSEAPEAFYLIGYAPQNLALDGRYHVLKVSLAHRSFDSVQARRGFYAPSGTETPEQAATRDMNDALFSDEQQHDLAVKMETPVAGATSSANGTAERKLSLVADLDVANMRFVKQDGANEDEVVLDAAIFDKDGNYVTGTKKTVSMRYDDNSLAQIEKTGAKVNFDFDVAPGEYTVRLVARDSNDQHLAAESEAVSVGK